MTNTQLSPGAVSQMWNKRLPVGMKPILQVLSAKPVTVGGSERFQVVVSDGSNYCSILLGSQLVELARKDLHPNTIVRIGDHIVNNNRDTVIVLVTDIEPLETAPTRIGNPVDVSAAIPAGQPQQPITTSNRVFAPPVVAQRPAPQVEHVQMNQGFQPQQQNQQKQNTYAPAPVSSMNASHAPVASLQSMIGGGVGNSRAMPRVVSIKLLNPYQHKWTIQARVTSKSEIRTWDKGPTNSGKLFSAELVDKDGGEIRSTFFREAVDSFYDLIRVGNVYLFSEGKVKVANRQFSSVKNEYEISFGKEAQIQAVQDDGNIARMNLVPVKINDLNGVEPKMNVDVVGIATEIGQVTSFVSKAGRDLKKMEMTLVDRSNASVKLTIWGNKAEEVSQELQASGPNPVVAVKSASVGDFGGRSLSSLNSSTIVINPDDLAEAGMLRKWFDEGHGRDGISSLTTGGGMGESRGPAPVQSRLTLEAIKTNGLGANGQQDYCDVKAYITIISKDSMWYPGCTTDKCKRKVTQSPTNSSWFCEKCNITMDAPLPLYIVRMQIADPTGSTWCTAFYDAANPILLGKTATEMEQLKNSDENEFNRVVDQACFQEGIFRMRVKEEQYQQQMQIKYSVMSYKPLDFVSENAQLQKAIEQYEAMQ